MNMHTGMQDSPAKFVLGYVEDLLQSGKTSVEVLKQLETDGYQIIRDGIYPNGIQWGTSIVTTVYHPDL